MSNETKAETKLLLTIQIDDIGTEGWLESVERWAKEWDIPLSEATLEDILGTFAHSQVHVTFLSVPGEKMMSHEVEVYVKPGRIVGAELK